MSGQKASRIPYAKQSLQPDHAAEEVIGKGFSSLPGGGTVPVDVTGVNGQGLPDQARRS